MTISMKTWVIFVVLSLINFLLNVTETITDLLKHYCLQKNATKCVKFMLERTTNSHLSNKICTSETIDLLISYDMFNV